MPDHILTNFFHLIFQQMNVNDLKGTEEEHAAIFVEATALLDDQPRADNLPTEVQNMA